MSTVNVKFYDAGRWADSPSQPVFDVEAGEVKAVSLSLADVVESAGKGEIVRPKRETSTGPIEKAESDVSSEPSEDKPKRGRRRKTPY